MSMHEYVLLCMRVWLSKNVSKIDVCIFESACLCMNECAWGCMCTCMYVCVCRVCVCASMCMCMCTCMCVCMCVCRVCVCVCVCQKIPTMWHEVHQYRNRMTDSQSQVPKQLKSNSNLNHYGTSTTASLSSSSDSWLHTQCFTVSKTSQLTDPKSLSKSLTQVSHSQLSQRSSDNQTITRSDKYG